MDKMDKMDVGLLASVVLGIFCFLISTKEMTSERLNMLKLGQLQR